MDYAADVFELAVEVAGLFAVVEGELVFAGSAVAEFVDFLVVDVADDVFVSVGEFFVVDAVVVVFGPFAAVVGEVVYGDGFVVGPFVEVDLLVGDVLGAFGTGRLLAAGAGGEQEDGEEED